MRIGIAALAGAIGLDLIGHLLAAPAIEEIAHVALLLAMVATLVVVVGGSRPRPGFGEDQGDRHAIR